MNVEKLLKDIGIEYVDIGKDYRVKCWYHEEHKPSMTIHKETGVWHCFSCPEEYGRTLANDGYLLSVPSSAYSFNRWQKVTKNAPLSALVTETDSYYQHPYQRGPVNVPSNARYAIAAIAYTHSLPQDVVSKKTIENASNFFDLKIE